MKNYDYWRSFARTGKVDDYLNYIACTREENSEISMLSMDITRNNMGISKQGLGIPMQSNMGIPKPSMGREREGGFIAGINYRDGNGSVSHAGW